MRTLCLFILSSLLSCSILADFGPWPHAYLLGKGPLSCETGAPCQAPTLEDIYALKNEWQRYEGRRIEHLEFLKEELRGLLDQALGLGQVELEAYDGSLYGQVMMKAAGVAEQGVSALYEGDLDLWVSNSSPAFQLFTDLEVLINQAKGGKLGRKEYRAWFKKHKETFEKLREIQERYFPKQKSENIAQDLLAVDIPLAQGVSFKECPKEVITKIEPLLGKVRLFAEGESLLSQEEKLKRFFPSSRNKNSIEIHCEAKGVSRALGFEKVGRRKFNLSYKKGSPPEVPPRKSFDVFRQY